MLTSSLPTGGLHIFSGFSPLVLFISLLHATGGILVALSVLYTSSVTKAMPCSLFVLFAWPSHCVHGCACDVFFHASAYFSSLFTLQQTVAVCGALVLTTVAESFAFGGPLSGNTVIGCLVVVLTITQYKENCRQEEAAKRKPLI